MEWRFSDGTIVQLDGHVEGEGVLAKMLRGQLELLAHGRARSVSVGPEPGGREELDPRNPYHVDSWCREWAHWLSTASAPITLVAGPKLPTVPASIDHEPGRVY